LKSQIYDEIPRNLGWSFDAAPDALQRFLLHFSIEHQLAYEKRCLKMINKHELRNEGELFTGCIRKCHKMQDRSFDLCRLRRSFFQMALKIASLAIREKMRLCRRSETAEPDCGLLGDKDLGYSDALSLVDANGLLMCNLAEDLPDYTVKWAENVVVDEIQRYDTDSKE
jgi:hypothetical protein